MIFKYFYLKICTKYLSLVTCGHRLDNIRITRVGDGKCTDSEVFSARGSQLNIVAGVVMDSSLC